MSQEEKAKWNRSYRERRSHAHFEGSRSEAVDWAEALLPESALILDVGCGLLRNCLKLGEAGHRILAVDVAIEAFRHAEAWPASIQPAVLDVDSWPLPPRTFDLLVMVHYLNRARLDDLVESIRPGGYLALEIRLARDHEGDEPPPFRLQPGEIPTLFPKLLLMKEETFFYGETECVRALLQRPQA